MSSGYENSPSPEQLREAIQDEYSGVATNPEEGRHFHTGLRACAVHGYDPSLYAGLPSENIASFAGTGNPFSAGPITEGEVILDIGSGAGMDSLIAGKLVSSSGKVIGIDMTPAMLKKARQGAEKMGFDHVEFREGFIEQLPVDDEFADVIISNGVLNLTLNKAKTLKEWWRALKPGGRLQIADIIIERSIPNSALQDISLWTS